MNHLRVIGHPFEKGLGVHEQKVHILALGDDLFNNPMNKGYIESIATAIATEHDGILRDVQGLA